MICFVKIQNRRHNIASPFSSSFSQSSIKNHRIELLSAVRDSEGFALAYPFRSGMKMDRQNRDPIK